MKLKKNMKPFNLNKNNNKFYGLDINYTGNPDVDSNVEDDLIHRNKKIILRRLAEGNLFTIKDKEIENSISLINDKKIENSIDLINDSSINDSSGNTL